ncbi:hypothetical protein Hamer_G025376 [Homarus americanus]|uniref:Uncharacterized protein n=1 Tax=Homarus americanus TaxID=6706 RepID=A0A8J5TIT9_HOMAM|nr:hypothetical protein Hamer_G025376 [Homarus americanus]
MAMFLWLDVTPTRTYRHLVTRQTHAPTLPLHWCPRSVLNLLERRIRKRLARRSGRWKLILNHLAPVE